MIMMVNIEVPQRFYQFNFNDNYDNCNVDTIIDLKIITQISASHKNINENCNTDRLIIRTSSPEPLIVINLKDNEVIGEIYSKLVTAWTTYKLATER